MKIWSWRHAIQLADIPAVTKLVLLNLSIYHNDRGEGFWPSYERQAIDTGLSRRSVIEHVQNAVQLGFLEKQPEVRDNGSSSSNRYFPVIPKNLQVQEVHGVVQEVHQVVNVVHHPSAGDSPPLVQEVHPPIESIKIESIDRSMDISGSSQIAPQPPISPKFIYFDYDNYSQIPKNVLVKWPRESGLPEEWGNYALTLGYEHEHVVQELEKFHAYWVYGKGNDPRKSVRGWRQSWNNWLTIESRRK